MESKEKVKQLVRFFIHPKQATTEDGRVVFVDTIYISVTNSKNDAPCLRAEPKHFAMFEKEWEHFKRSDAYKVYTASQEEGALSYTPLDSLGITPATVANLKAAGVRSVEALIATDMDKLAHIRGIQTVYEKAGAFAGVEPAETVDEVAPVAVVVDSQKNRGGRPRKAA